MNRKNIVFAVLFLLGLGAGYFFASRGSIEVDKPPKTDQGNMTQVPDTYGQSDDVLASFHQGKAEKLMPFLAEEVELVLLEEEDIFTSEEAIVQLNRFFSDHQVKGFNDRHRGQSGGGENSYLIGDLRSADDSFRTYVNFNKEKIVEIRIEKE